MPDEFGTNLGKLLRKVLPKPPRKKPKPRIWIWVFWNAIHDAALEHYARNRAAKPLGRLPI